MGSGKDAHVAKEAVLTPVVSTFFDWTEPAIPGTATYGARASEASET
jgi:hypothetical protein